MIHGIVRTDKIDATDVRNGLVSVRVSVQDGLDNGSVAVLRGAEDKSNRYGREVYEISTATAESNIESLIILVAPELDTYMQLHSLSWYYNEFGDIARGYRIHNGDIISVTKEALDGFDDSIGIGSIIELPVGSYKLRVSQEQAEESILIGIVTKIEEIDGYTICEFSVGDANYNSGGDVDLDVVGTAVVGTSVAR